VALNNQGERKKLVPTLPGRPGRLKHATGVPLMEQEERNNFLK